MVTLLGRINGSTLIEKLLSCSSMLSSTIVTLKIILVTPAGNEILRGPKMKSNPSINVIHLCR